MLFSVETALVVILILALAIRFFENSVSNDGFYNYESIPVKLTDITTSLPYIQNGVGPTDDAVYVPNSYTWNNMNWSPSIFYDNKSETDATNIDLNNIQNSNNDNRIDI